MESIIKFYKSTDTPDYTQVPYSFNSNLNINTYCYLPSFILNSEDVTSLILEQVNTANINDISVIKSIDLGIDNIETEGIVSFQNKIELDNDMINLIRKKGNYRYKIVANSIVYFSTIFQLSCFVEPVEPLLLTLVGTDESSALSNDASIKCQAAQGVYPYQFKLDAGSYQSSNMFSGLNSGTYTVTCKDAENTEVSEVINLKTALEVAFTIVGNSDEQNPNGSIAFIITGGLPPYTTSINAGVNFSSSTLYENLTDADYYTVVRDSGGRQVETKVTVPALPQPLEVEYVQSIYSAISLSAFAVVGRLRYNSPTDYDIITFETTQGNFVFNTIPYNGSPVSGQVRAIDPLDERNYTNLAADLSLNAAFTALYDITTVVSGVYTDVYIISKNQETLQDSYIIEVAVTNSLAVPRNETVFFCQRGFKYVITLTGSGGTPPYVYKFKPADPYTNNNVLTTTLSTQYQDGYIKDALNNESTVPFDIEKNLSFTPYMIRYTYEGGELEIEYFGYYAPYQYSLNGINYQNSNIFNVGSGTYTIYVKEANNDVNQLEITI